MRKIPPRFDFPIRKWGIPSSFEGGGGSRREKIPEGRVSGSRASPRKASPCLSSGGRRGLLRSRVPPPGSRPRSGCHARRVPHPQPCPLPPSSSSSSSSQPSSLAHLTSLRSSHRPLGLGGREGGSGLALSVEGPQGPSEKGTGSWSVHIACGVTGTGSGAPLLGWLTGS